MLAKTCWRRSAALRACLAAQRALSTGQTAAPVVFARDVKRSQRNRAATHPAARQTDYLRDEVAQRLVDRLLDIKRRFPTIVDVGAAAGHVAAHLDTDITAEVIMCDSAEQLLHRDINTVAYDREDVPRIRRIVVDEEDEADFSRHFADNSLDAIVSSLALHWVNDLPGVLARFIRVLKPDGVLVAAMFGGDSLFELRTSLQLAELERCGGMSPRVSPMTKVSDVANLLQRTGFALITVDIDEIVVHYPTPFDLMEDLRAMGETNAVVHRLPHLGRDTLIAASAIYEAMHGTTSTGPAESLELPSQPPLPGAHLRTPKSVPATFQVVYMIGWKPAATQPQPLARGSGRVSLKQVL